ncbi:MAG TPA: tRNA pseudouridine(55) synthase TruB [Pyrinomonadaceae bacterium]|nr:tRNA pseudouridine(55) synthase TruB [Pyrinomonadaceae bacterium]
MNGVLIIDKPVGWTSHDVVARVRRVLKERRVGHTGTLDPFATGVLVVLVGRATRLAQFFAGAEKEYVATVRFGYATETGDLTGARRELPQAEDVTGDAARARPCAEWSRAEIESALASLRGEIEQVPPMYSAKKIQGKKLYELARRGVEVERAAVSVTISELEVLEQNGAWLVENEDGTCDLVLRVVCSAGTYIRVLAEDLGARLGAGAHLSALRRTRAGAFHIAQAMTLEHLAERVDAGDPDAASGLLITPDAALSEMPFVHLTGEDARRARHGAALRIARDFVAASHWREGEHVRMRDAAGNLIAVGIYDAGRGQLQPRVMLDVGDEK